MEPRNRYLTAKALVAVSYGTMAKDEQKEPAQHSNRGTRETRPGSNFKAEQDEYQARACTMVRRDEEGRKKTAGDRGEMLYGGKRRKQTERVRKGVGRRRVWSVPGHRRLQGNLIFAAGSRFVEHSALT